MRNFLRSANHGPVLTLTCLAIPAIAVISTAAVAAQPVPTVASGYTLSTFASAPAGSSAPDSIAVVKDTVWVSYGNGGKPDGSNGAKSTIVEYSNQGQVMRSLTLDGHSDGLRLDPHTNKLWSMQNEDSNPNLVLIDPTTGSTELYKIPATLHGGGYDDIAFAGDGIYVSASNPTPDSKGNVTGPSIVRMTLNADDTVTVIPVVAAAATAIDVTTGKATTLNLTDPDSMIPMPSGSLLLDDQGDAQLVMLDLASASMPDLKVLPLAGGVQVDDTVFATTHGYLLVSDRGTDTVYKLEAAEWPSGAALTASTGVPATTTAPITPAIPAFVGRLDLTTGATTPIVSNLVSPHGMAFVETQ